MEVHWTHLVLSTAVVKKRISKTEIQKYDPTPMYLYTAKDQLNRVTVLKETNKDAYLIAGRYSGFNADHRQYNPLSEEERQEIEKLVRMGRKDATISFL
jgi:hypothetical protein